MYIILTVYRLVDEIIHSKAKAKAQTRSSSAFHGCHWQRTLVNKCWVQEENPILTTLPSRNHHKARRFISGKLSHVGRFASLGRTGGTVHPFGPAVGAVVGALPPKKERQGELLQHGFDEFLATGAKVLS